MIDTSGSGTPLLACWLFLSGCRARGHAHTHITHARARTHTSLHDRNCGVIVLMRKCVSTYTHGHTHTSGKVWQRSGLLWGSTLADWTLTSDIWPMTFYIVSNTSFQQAHLSNPIVFVLCDAAAGLLFISRVLPLSFSHSTQHTQYYRKAKSAYTRFNTHMRRHISVSFDWGMITVCPLLRVLTAHSYSHTAGWSTAQK